MKTLLKMLGYKPTERKALKQLQAETVYKDELIDFKQPIFGWRYNEYHNGKEIQNRRCC